MPEAVACFRFYEELNDFLAGDRCKRTFEYHFTGTPAVKDAIEALGVPHTEVDLILANGESVRFDYRLQNGDRIAVYPVFEALDISPIVRLREQPLRRSRFVLDVHLGKLARLLRMLGFDVFYRNDYADCDIIAISLDEGRTILTRDRRLLFTKVVTRGYWLRSTEPEKQCREVLERFDLYSQIKPFSRCLLCNGAIEAVDQSRIIDQLEPRTKRHFDVFHRCTQCGKLYWKGSHFDRMTQMLTRLQRE
jgi:uncharacterized protein